MHAEIDRWCRDHRAEMLATLERIVNVDSASPLPEGVEAVADVLEPLLRAAGCATERVGPQVPAGLDWLLPALLPELGAFERAARSLVGRRAGTGAAAHALLIGHMDTAFPIGEAARNPFRLDGERATGCSIADMKSGLVVLLFAVRALDALGLPAPRITVIYNSDEQAATITSRALIERVAREEGVTHAFVAEMGRAGGGIVRQRAALGIGVLEISGVARHVGTGYWEGASAIRALAAKIPALEALSDRARSRIVNVGVVQGGTRRNLVADRAVAHLDIRAPSTADWQALADEVRTIAAREELPGTGATLHLYNTRPSMDPTPATDTLVAVVAGAAGDLGQEVDFVATTGGSDASFPAALGIPTLDGFGAVGGATMTADEYILVDTLVERAALLATTLARL